MVINVIRDLQDTQQQLNPTDPTTLLFKLFDEELPKPKGTLRVYTQNIGHAFTVGHPTNGIVGTALGVDGQQITIGAGGLGALTVSRVVSDNNTFIEPLRDNSYVDTTNTTATVDTVLHKVTF